jgi:CheY-like chemotaxis protein
MLVGQNDPPRLEGVHVLVIDFDADVRDLVRMVLEPLGALVTTATAAGAAETTIVADVILCDLELVEATGHVFLATLRRKHQPRGRPAPALAVVTGGHPPADVRVRAAGFQGYIMKPVQPHELRRAVWELVPR